MVNDSRTLQERLARFLTKQYPALGAADLLARDIGVESRTARNYLGGMWPGAQAWKGIVRRFGRDVLAAVFDPEIDETSARLAEECRALEEQLENRKAALRAAGGRPARLAAPENGE